MPRFRGAIVLRGVARCLPCRFDFRGGFDGMQPMVGLFCFVVFFMFLLEWKLNYGFWCLWIFLLLFCDC